MIQLLQLPYKMFLECSILPSLKFTGNVFLESCAQGVPVRNIQERQFSLIQNRLIWYSFLLCSSIKFSIYFSFNWNLAKVSSQAQFSLTFSWSILFVLRQNGSSHKKGKLSFKNCKRCSAKPVFQILVEFYPVKNESDHWKR